jgi:hypothetical protein
VEMGMRGERRSVERRRGEYMVFFAFQGGFYVVGDVHVRRHGSVYTAPGGLPGQQGIGTAAVEITRG